MSDHLDPQEARQGKSGVGVKTVLIISLVLAAIAFVFVNFYGETTDNDPSIEETIENN